MPCNRACALQVANVRAWLTARAAWIDQAMHQAVRQGPPGCTQPRAVAPALQAATSGARAPLRAFLEGAGG